LDYETWNELQFYESTEVLKQLAREHIGFDMNSGQAEDIRACLHQAREYFRSADKADITVKPLLLFYGMSSFSIAITMLYGGKERSRLCNLPHKHGLDFPTSFDAPLDEITCEVQEKGTFPNFNEVVAKNETVIHDDIQAQVTNASSDSLVGKKLNLRELWACIPELGMLYRKTFDSFATTLEANLSKYSEAEYSLSLEYRMGSSLWYPAPDQDELEAVLGNFLQIEGSHVSKHPLWTTIYFPTLPNLETRWIEAQKAESGVRGLLVSQAHQLPLLAPLSVQFMGMYTLGMVVRYRPDCWIEVTQLGRNDRSLAIAKAFIAYCEERFPFEILRILADPNHRHKLAV
jgi:hypothetical protein